MKLPVFLEKHFKILHHLRVWWLLWTKQKKITFFCLFLHYIKLFSSHIISFPFPWLLALHQKYGFAQFFNEIWWYPRTILFPYRAYTASFIMEANGKITFTSWNLVCGKLDWNILLCRWPSMAQDHLVQHCTLWSKNKPQTKIRDDE